MFISYIKQKENVISVLFCREEFEKVYSVRCIAEWWNTKQNVLCFRNG